MFDRSRLPDAADFYEREGLTLLGKGTWRRALCVFHDDHDPSLHVNVESGAWSCKACGAKGSMIDFVMQRRGLEFRAACEVLGIWVMAEKDAYPRRMSKRDLALAAIVVVANGVIAAGRADDVALPILREAVHRIHAGSKRVTPTELDALTIFIVIRDLLLKFRVTEQDWQALVAAVGRSETYLKKNRP